jgi:hypothetical protein
MFTDEHRRKVWDQLRQHDFRAFTRLLPDTLFIEAAAGAGLRIRRCPLNVVTLVWLGIASALRQMQSFASVLPLALKLLQDSEYGPAFVRRKTPRRGWGGRRRSKHDPRGRDPLGLTEEAFVKARRRMPLAFWTTLLVLLGERFEGRHGRWVRWKRFRLLALDGTCLSLPGWKRLAKHFGRAKNGRSPGPAQARLVMLQLPLARLPWRYTLGPKKKGETTEAVDLLRQVRGNDLVLMDQGFWSYGLFWTIQDRQAFFAIRLRPGVRLRTVKHLGPKDRLVQVRKPAGKRWRNSPWPASLTLRVVAYQIAGFRPSAVVTNVLKPKVVSRAEWVRLSTQTAAGSQRLDVGLYHRRWEIETTFRELKVTQAMEGGLRSRTPEGIAYEVAGHVLLYLLVRWLIVEAATKAGKDPLAVSFTGALRELLDLTPLLVTSNLEHVQRVLLPRLLARMALQEIPFRPGRHYPRPHDTEIRNLGNGRRRLPHKLRKTAK